MSFNKLTKHSVGSLREIWTISWPLMLGLLSSSFMLFADRLFLARYSMDALTASASAGMATYLLIIIPITIAGMSEVFVGRLNGEGNLCQIGKPVWQMIWFSSFIAPLFWIGGRFLAPLFFYGTDHQFYATQYFTTLIDFDPFLCASIALMGFFTGTGRVRIITICSILANVVNIGLDVVLIFGYGPFPEMGIQGAALATGISQVAQAAFLLILFLLPANREKYGTGKWAFHLKDFIKAICIGTPAGLGHIIEILAHFFFFRIIMTAGYEVVTIISLVQSFYYLVGFFAEGLSKGVTTIVANLIGSKQTTLIHKVVKSAMKLQLLFFAVALLFVTLLIEPLMPYFFSETDKSLLQNASFVTSLKWSSIWMAIFFLFEGFYWILIGYMTAAGDTKFIFYAGIILNWIVYIFPIYLLIQSGYGSADGAWLLVTVYSCINFLVYLWRTRSLFFKKDIFLDKIRSKSPETITDIKTSTFPLNQI